MTSNRPGTAPIPGWLGHTYTTTGTLTVTAALRWSAQYTIDGGPPLDVPGTVPNPTAR